MDLHYPWAAQDEVHLTLAPNLAVESLPKDAAVPLEQFAKFASQYKMAGNTYQQVSILLMGNPLYSAAEYPKLRDFFQKTNTQDQQQLVLTRSALASAAGDTSGKSE